MKRRLDHMKVPSYCDDEPEPDARWPILDTFNQDPRPHNRDTWLVAEHAKNLALLEYYTAFKDGGDPWFPISYPNGAVQYVPIDNLIAVVSDTLQRLQADMH